MFARLFFRLFRNNILKDFFVVCKKFVTFGGDNLKKLGKAKFSAFEKLCEERNVIPAQVSKETGIATATLSAWKLGKYSPKIDKIMAIADFFGVQIGVFYE